MQGVAAMLFFSHIDSSIIDTSNLMHRLTSIISFLLVSSVKITISWYSGNLL